MIVLYVLQVVREHFIYLNNVIHFLLLNDVVPYRLIC